MQPESITRRFRALALAALLPAAALFGIAEARQPAVEPGPGWRPAPAYLTLFTPPRHQASYEAFVSSRPLEQALAGLLARVPALRAPGAWAPDSEAAADAFGSGGRYDRWRLLRLYARQSPSVARGAVVREDGRLEAWTLMSPFPDPELRRLDPGTLLLVLRIP